MEDKKDIKNLEKETEENNLLFEDLDLEFFSDISLNVKVEIGKAHKIFLDILKLKEGDVVQLNKNIEDYIDIYINGKHFAIGEMVIVNDKYSVRVIDLV